MKRPLRLTENLPTIVRLDAEKVAGVLGSYPVGSIMTIPFSSASTGAAIGELTGQTVKTLEQKEIILKFQTDKATYNIPTNEIKIDDVLKAIGENIKLKDITVRVQISEPAEQEAKLVADTAKKGNMLIAASPVSFEITCSYGGKKVTVERFNNYVERLIPIPAGIDPSKITTGIVLNLDGTFSHVPTLVEKVGDKYYAKINSLTNSTYSVIYNPMEFKDVASHWAKK